MMGDGEMKINCWPQDSGTGARTECTTGPARPCTTSHGSSL